MHQAFYSVQAEYREVLRVYLEYLLEDLGATLKAAVVFGSVARREAGPGSDVDLLLIVDGLPDYVDERMALVRDAYRRLRESKCYAELRSRGLGSTVSEVILTPKELFQHPPILLEVLVEGIILYDPEAMLEQTLRELSSVLEKLGSKLVKAARGHYWILKPDAPRGEEIVV